MRVQILRISQMRGQSFTKKRKISSHSTQSEHKARAPNRHSNLSHSLHPAHSSLSPLLLSFHLSRQAKSWSQLGRRNLAAFSSEALLFCRAVAVLIRRNLGTAFSSEASEDLGHCRAWTLLRNPSLLGSCASLPPPNLPLLQPQQDSPTNFVSHLHCTFSFHLANGFQIRDCALLLRNSIRLQRMDTRLARIEDHLSITPPQGGAADEDDD
nr:uncharacterized protein LOC113708031 [Coffea arabica]